MYYHLFDTNIKNKKEFKVTFFCFDVRNEKRSPFSMIVAISAI
jgi:hypothetical protein